MTMADYYVTLNRRVQGLDNETEELTELTSEQIVAIEECASLFMYYFGISAIAENHERTTRFSDGSTCSSKDWRRK